MARGSLNSIFPLLANGVSRSRNFLELAQDHFNFRKLHSRITGWAETSLR